MLLLACPVGVVVIHGGCVGVGVGRGFATAAAAALAVLVSFSGLLYDGAPSTQVAFWGHAKGPTGKCRRLAAVEEDAGAGEEGVAVGD